MSRDAPHWIYVVETQIGVVKIGCSANPVSRAKTISTHSPLPTRLVAAVPGIWADERALHERFADYMTHNEWFRCEGPVAEFVASIRGQGVERIIDWSETTRASREERRRQQYASHGAKIRANFAAKRLAAMPAPAEASQ